MVPNQRQQRVRSQSRSAVIQLPGTVRLDTSRSSRLRDSLLSILPYLLIAALAGLVVAGVIHSQHDRHPETASCSE